MGRTRKDLWLATARVLRHAASASGFRRSVTQSVLLVRRARQRKACALDVTLWSEVLAGDDPWMRMLFPVNSLRSR